MKPTGGTARPDLAVRNKHPRQRVNSALLRRILLTAISGEPFALDATSGAAHELCVVFVGDAEMAQLNQRWLGHAGTTDVITFDHSSGRSAVEPRSPLQGDIVISLDEAGRHGQRLRTGWQSEVVRYLVHGLLHLRGFDDSDAEKRRRMRQAENKILKVLRARFDLQGIGFRSGVRQFTKRICDL